MKQRWLDCYRQRTIINSRCWNNPDPQFDQLNGNLGHQQQAAQAIYNAGQCDERIAEPEPIGCADPCP